MSKRIGLISFLILLLFEAQAQNRLNYADVDKKSYELFQEKKWNELIRFSDIVSKQGIDFFYLQVRTGIAWYSKGKYREATPYFLRAYANDSSFEWLQEYLYYSLVYSGRSLEALKYAPDFSDAIKKKIGFFETGLTRIAYETGYSFNSDFENQVSRAFSTEVNLGTNYGEGYFLRNYSFHSIDLSHRVGSNLTLNHNLTYVGQNRETVVNWSGQTSSKIKINQLNYYINPVWVIGKKLNISPSLSLIAGITDVYDGYLRNNSAKIFSLTKQNYSDAVVSTSIWSNFGQFAPGLEVNAGSINDSKFAQLSSWVTWYPLSNTKLYFKPQVYFKSTSETGFGYNTFSISGGIQLYKLHLTGQFLSGNMENFVESGGYLIANFPGRSNRKIMGSVYFPFGNKYHFVLRYINQKMIEKYRVYNGDVEINSLEYNYLKNTLTGGVSWNF